MIKMKLKKSTLFTRLCAAGLAVLGFSCSSDEPEEIVCMYGAISGRFEIKGKVTTEDGKVVPNAEIRVTRPDFPSSVYPIAISKTEEAGNYTLNGSDYFNQLKVVCVPEDSNLEADSTIVDLKYINGDKGSGWYQGEADATVDFKLKNKNKDQ